MRWWKTWNSIICRFIVFKSRHLQKLCTTSTNTLGLCLRLKLFDRNINAIARCGAALGGFAPTSLHAYCLWTITLLNGCKARRPPGRPRKLQVLDRAPDSNALPSSFYAVENLIATLTKSPSRFLNWSVVKEFAIDGEAQNMQGTITSWANRNGIYAWTIEFAGREPEVVPMQELAQIIAYTHATGGTFTH
ncbi:hypothetical protein V7S43_010813 [Phytophthora oleae]|uniref:Uncharacterized protein n=1 Tax=Phytophthora oleae TaxID=2107226 RepID=A0ABD3FEJ6_9STRA